MNAHNITIAGRAIVTVQEQLEVTSGLILMSKLRNLFEVLPVIYEQKKLKACEQKF